MTARPAPPTRASCPQPQVASFTGHSSCLWVERACLCHRRQALRRSSVRLDSSSKHCEEVSQHRGASACRDLRARQTQQDNIAWRHRLPAALAAAVASALVHLDAHAIPAAVLQGPARVIDGDTLEVAGARVRLYGVDAPEKAQLCTSQAGSDYTCGEVAAAALRSKVGQAAVVCEVRQHDQYGRDVSTCMLPGMGDIGKWMVSNGYAVAYRQYSQQYVPDEHIAQDAHRGIWAGSFQAPAEWRRQRKIERLLQNTHPAPSLVHQLDPSLALASPMPATTPPGCRIKGNIGSRGTKIYHLPGQAHYDQTKVNTSAGEHWFCSEAEAQAAGWRVAKD